MTSGPAIAGPSDVGRALAERVRRVGAEVAGPAADSVDRDARFPREGIDALRAEGLLAAYVPPEYGGSGCTVSDLSVVCRTLGEFCASTAMVFAMHQIQVACIVRHGATSPFFRDYLQDLVRDGRLIASATTEAGVGGDLRSSVCAVETDGDQFRLEKNATVISYGEHVDDVLATARRGPDASPNDQVLVLVRRPGLDLKPNGTWDTLGMRGTCSLGFLLTATGRVDQIIPVPFSDISNLTMLPVSHIVWSSLWLGIATDAVNRARSYVRLSARKTPGTVPPAAVRLAEVYVALGEIAATVESAVRDYEANLDDADAMASPGMAIRMNNLKVSVSRGVLDVIAGALSICGILGYKNDSPFSVGRHLRDAHSASLMVHNDRILAHTAALLCVYKDA